MLVPDSDFWLHKIKTHNKLTVLTTACKLDWTLGLSACSQSSHMPAGVSSSQYHASTFICTSLVSNQPQASSKQEHKLVRLSMITMCRSPIPSNAWHHGQNTTKFGSKQALSFYCQMECKAQQENCKAHLSQDVISSRACQRSQMSQTDLCKNTQHSAKPLLSC